MHLTPPGAPFPPPPDLPHVHTPENPLANPSSGDVLYAHTFAPIIGGGGTSSSGGSGTVTSITLTQPAAGLTITGSGTPITTTGTPTFALANDLASLEAISGTNVIPYRSAADTWGTVTIGTGLQLVTGTLSLMALGAAGDSAAGIIELAVQSEMETATDVVRAVVPGRQHFHPSAAKAWVIFDASSGTPSILASRNVSSITDGGVGVFTVNFTTAFSSTSYVAVGICGLPGTTNGYVVEGASRTASAYPFACLSSAGAVFDASRISLVFFGDQ